MNAAVIIVVLTTLLIHCGHCQQKVTFSALQDNLKTLHSLNMRSISNRQSQTCTEAEATNIFAGVSQECVSELPSVENLPSNPNQNTAVICQQECRNALLTFFTQCNFPQHATILGRLCTGNNAGTHNAGSSAEAPTFFKALFLMTFIVMAMLLL